MDRDDEFSLGGSRIFRHTTSRGAATVAAGDEEAHRAIDEHIRTYLGEPANVFHELLSETVHIDVHIVAPSEEDNCYTLITTGMSDLPMRVPPGAEEFRYSELLISLPPAWTPGPLWEADMSDESLYWPIRLLKMLARLPHSYDTWLSYGHTVPNGDPPKAYAADTKLCCALLLPSFTLDPEFSRLTIRSDKTVSFFTVIPLYDAEMRFKLDAGTDALIDRLVEGSVTEILDPQRPSVVEPSRFMGV